MMILMMQLRTAKAPPLFPVAQSVPVNKPHPTTEANQATPVTSSVAADKPKSDFYAEGHDEEGCTFFMLA